MKIKIWEIERSKDNLELSYTEDLTKLADTMNDLKAISPVNVSLSAKKFAGLYTIKGKISTVLRLQCSRCLENFDLPLEERFEEIFVQDNDDLDTYEENINLLDSDEINISEIVEETILLNIPYIPLCREDCKGLCPVCGTNLNKETCDCKVEKIDPRLADLEKWFDQNKSNE